MEVSDFKSGEHFKQIQRENQKLIDTYRRHKVTESCNWRTS